MAKTQKEIFLARLMHERDKFELLLNRIGYAQDIGPVVAFLCTEDAAWVNGQRIEVSGGINV